MKYYIGIDVSKNNLDVDWCGKAKRYTNNISGIKELIKKLKALKEEEKLVSVVCEASGGYEKNMVRACHEAQIPIHVAHANKVRHFAKSQGLLAKTDKLDAQVLSDYGRLLQPEPDNLLLSENAEKIAELLKRREQLLADRKREKNRLDKISNKDIKESIKDHIEWLNKKLKEIEKKLSAQKKAEVKTAHDLLTSVPAVGDICAYYLLSSLPEMGELSHKEIAALVGVAPYNNDSGNAQGKRFIRGGRSQLRQILYMAGLTAIRRNAPLRSFYTHLRNGGKPAKVALIAVVRKLLTMVNSVIKRQTPWEDDYRIVNEKLAA